MSTRPSSEQPGEQPSISDEELEAFLRAAAEGGGAGEAPKEPSARARMVARRLREQGDADPPGWRTGPTGEEARGRARRRRGWGAALGVLLTVGLAVVAIRPSLVLDHLPGGDDTPQSASASASPADSADGPTLDAPFRGSPARSWAEGADAIDLPAAEAVGDMSEKDVELALRRTKEFLVAANLDPEVRRGGHPEKALSLLDPRQPDMLPDARRSLRSPDREHDPVALFTRFDPDEVRPVGDVVKVRGTMTYEAGKPGQVRVRADYTFVYPVTKAERGADRVSRAIVRRELVLLLSDPARWTATPGKLQVERYDAAFFNVSCENEGGFLHPSFPSTAPTASPPTGPDTDPYDRETPLGEVLDGEDCGTVTRT
ncbi:hypothetical protein AB0K92_00985 [Streptomyces sp. NPDC052687]|uniref:hypothetical protein n=1 Tax=Streptomyces sp. NPDC052687 TaxID=3154759 RepID=UPI003444FD24